MDRSRIVGILGLCLLGLSSCFKPEEKPLHSVSELSQSLLVLNEGNFQWGNASIHRYDPKSKSYDDQDLFSRVNQRPLGDVLQSGLV